MSAPIKGRAHDNWPALSKPQHPNFLSRTPRVQSPSHLQGNEPRCDENNGSPGRASTMQAMSRDARASPSPGPGHPCRWGPAFRRLPFGKLEGPAGSGHAHRSRPEGHTHSPPPRGPRPQAMRPHTTSHRPHPRLHPSSPVQAMPHRPRPAGHAPQATLPHAMPPTTPPQVTPQATSCKAARLAQLSLPPGVGSSPQTLHPSLKPGLF